MEKEPEKITGKRPRSEVSDTQTRQLSASKPSYLLCLGPKASRNDYLNRLPKLLRGLLRQGEWINASRTLSVLIQGTLGDSSPKMNRLISEAHIQIVTHLLPNKNKLAQVIGEIYDTWISKIGKQHQEERLSVWFHQICHFIEHGMDEEAYSCVISLMQNRDLGSLPRSNLIIGISSYKMWCCKFTKDFQPRDAKCNKNISTKSESRSSYSVESVSNYERLSHLYVSDSLSSTDTEDKRPQQFANPPRLYADDFSEEESQVSLLDGVGRTCIPTLIQILGNMDPWLLPLIPPEDPDCYTRMLTDTYYKDALKYMKLTLQSPPHISLAALHPFVQLLLIGGHFDEAMKVVEEMCNKVHDIKTFRMKTAMLETFHADSNKLSESYEDILKIDPTCATTLKKLIGMCKGGKCSREPLIEMIALHVEVSFPEPGIWKEFASCLRNLFKNLDEDRLSGSLPDRQTYSVRYNQTPKMVTGTSWILRAKCWLYRHFSPEMLETEIKNCDTKTYTAEDRDWKMVTYKAACASHIYGRGFVYVTKVHGLLKEKSECRILYNLLQEHRQNENMIYNPCN